jgi:hypothetical protein
MPRVSSGVEGLAGWLFADLMLVLAAIGIASIEVKDKTLPPATFALNCKSYLFTFTKDESTDSSKMNRRFADSVKAALTQRGIDPGNGRPGLFLLYGGYESPETTARGQERATEILPFVKRLPRMSKIPNRIGGAMKIDGQPIGRNSFALIVFFTYSGPDSVSGCSEDKSVRQQTE